MRTKSHCVKVDPWHSIKLLKPVYHSQTHCGLKLSSKMQAGTLLDHSLVRSDKLQHKTMEKKKRYLSCRSLKVVLGKIIHTKFLTQFSNWALPLSLTPRTACLRMGYNQIQVSFPFSIKEKFCGSLQASVVSSTF